MSTADAEQMCANNHFSVAQGIALLPRVRSDGSGHIIRYSFKERIPHIRGHLCSDAALEWLAGIYPAETYDSKLDQLKAARAEDQAQFKRELREKIETTDDSYLFLNALCLFLKDVNLHDILSELYPDARASNYANFVRHGSDIGGSISGVKLTPNTAALISDRLELDKHPDLKALFEAKVVVNAQLSKQTDMIAAEKTIKQFSEMLRQGFQRSDLNPTTFFNLTVPEASQINPEIIPVTIHVSAQAAIERIGSEQWPDPQQFAAIMAAFKACSDRCKPEQCWFDAPYATTNTKHPAFGKPFSEAIQTLYEQASLAREQMPKRKAARS